MCTCCLNVIDILNSDVTRASCRAWPKKNSKRQDGNKAWTVWWCFKFLNKFKCDMENCNFALTICHTGIKFVWHYFNNAKILQCYSLEWTLLWNVCCCCFLKGWRSSASSSRCIVWLSLPSNEQRRQGKLM